MTPGLWRLTNRLLLIAVLTSPAERSLAGPPLSIDDPGIAEPGHFEFIVAGNVETRDSGSSWLFPILDVTYGVSTDFQVGFVATRAIESPDDSGTKSDFGPGAVGIKWRFLDQDALQMSVAPYYETLLREGAEKRGVTDDIDAWNLPLEFQYDFEGWRLNAEVRYAVLRGDRDEWTYGVAAGYPVSDRLEVMAEVHGGADRTFDDHGVLFRLGMDLAVTEAFHVLASAGSSIDESGDDDLNLQGYLGLQWFH